MCRAPLGKAPAFDINLQQIKKLDRDKRSSLFGKNSAMGNTVDN